MKLKQYGYNTLQGLNLWYHINMATKSIRANKKSQLKKNAWFTPVRGSYLPANRKGWLTYIPFVAYLAYAWFVAFAYTGNDLKAVLWIVPNWVAAAAVMTWIAKRTS